MNLLGFNLQACILSLIRCRPPSPNINIRRILFRHWLGTLPATQRSNRKGRHDGAKRAVPSSSPCWIWLRPCCARFSFKAISQPFDKSDIQFSVRVCAGLADVYNGKAKGCVITPIVCSDQRSTRKGHGPFEPRVKEAADEFPGIASNAATAQEKIPQGPPCGHVHVACPGAP